jgi:uncharacterized protein (TIGR03492 family)
MTRVLFVSNGHGEIAIAARIARDLPESIASDHLALVAVQKADAAMRDVGPRRVMPSGGLIAMANLRSIAQDVRAGLLGLTLAQLRFLRRARGEYAAVIAVGDTYALAMSLAVREPAVFVGTAKSVYVAPYGAFEERIIGRARAVFVRDEATAERLCRHGIAAQAANVIADLYADTGVRAAPLPPFEPRLAIFPGSRQAAYEDAVRLCAIVREIAEDLPQAGGILSVAGTVDADRLAAALARDGWHVAHDEDRASPFSLSDGGREIVRAHRDGLGAMLHGAAIVLGQAGTANEAAAALGVPVVALASGQTAWYRRRQMALLDGAMLLVDPQPRRAAARIRALLDDRFERERMSRIGRERMGPPGGALRVAQEVARLCA